MSRSHPFGYEGDEAREKESKKEKKKVKNICGTVSDFATVAVESSTSRASSDRSEGRETRVYPHLLVAGESTKGKGGSRT